MTIYKYIPHFEQSPSQFSDGGSSFIVTEIISSRRICSAWSGYCDGRSKSIREFEKVIRSVLSVFRGSYL